MMTTLSLDGLWELRWSDVQRGPRPDAFNRPDADPAYAIPAQVPGAVHLDLERAGILPDRNRNLGHLAGRWVEQCRWVYRRTFATPNLAGRVWLHLESLDHDAVILLNGIEIGRHANSFRPCRLELTGRLAAGANNILVIQIESGLHGAADKPSAGFLQAYDLTSKRHWLRKPQNQAGWDWSPRLMNVGLQGPVRLEWTAAGARFDQVSPLATVSDDLATGHLRVRAHCEGLGTAPQAAELRIRCAGQDSIVPVEITPGFQTCEATLTIAAPQLWWPIGQGAQHRYVVETTLTIAGQVVATHTSKVGFRHLRFDQSPCPAGGRWFFLEINQRRIFCKGGNYVPADTVIAAIDASRSRRLVELARDQHFNLLRVWGGGRYEDQAFYEACDELGMLVWQEFIFACSRYPGTDGAFYNEIEAEATYQVRRLATHPSLFAWCGNNENELGAYDWGYAKGNPLPDHQLYHHLLPHVVAREDGSRWWQPSSPYSPDLLPPNADDVGDQHPWSLGFADTDFRKYRSMDCRFPNEGGFLGPNSLPTVRACLPPGEDHTWSFAWQQHDNAIAHWNDPCPQDLMLRTWIDRDIRRMTIADYVYWGGLVHGEALSEYITNFRHRRSTTTGAAIFWMYNDNWPTVRSWTTIDYYLRKTPAFHPVRRAFAPVSVVVHEQGEHVVITGVNDTPAPLSARLRHGLIELAGNYVRDLQADVVLAPNAATELASFPRTAWTDPKTQIAFAVLTQDGQVVARHRLILPLFREMAWPVAQPHVRVEAGQAIFTSDVFCWGVCLDLDGEVDLADNFFDVYPGQPYAIPWTATEAPHILYVGNLNQ